MAPATIMILDRDIRYTTIQDPATGKWYSRPTPTPPVVYPVRPRPAVKRCVDGVVALRQRVNKSRLASRRLTTNPKKIRRAMGKRNANGGAA